MEALQNADMLITEIKVK